MKVAIIGSPKFDSLEYHIKDELLFQGHIAEIFDYVRIVNSKFDSGLSLMSMDYVVYINRNLLNRVLEFEPDLVIGVYRHIHPLVVKGVKLAKIRIIHVNPDQITTLQNQQLFAEPYDFYFSKDPYMVDFISNKLNFKCNLYLEAFNPRIHRKPDIDRITLENKIDIDVLCFGNLYPYRNRMLILLKESNIRLKLFGNKTKYFDNRLLDNFENRSIFGQEKAELLNGAKIVFNNFHFAEIESVNNKFFEITGAGAFQICDYKPMLKDLLPIDPELISFKSIDEAKDLIHFYLSRPEKRYEIRDVLASHFLEHYTYARLLNTILFE